MSPRGRRTMWALIAAGLLGRVVLGALTYGVEYDIRSSALAAGLLARDPLEVYGSLESMGHAAGRWPYPSGLFPWLAAAHELAQWTGVAFHAILGLPAMAADAGIAWLVQDHLRRRGAGERTRLAAVALVMLGPSFAIISGYHHQFDSIAWLPAVAAVWLWERRAGGRRALACGALVGAGALCKTMPILVLLVLLPTYRDRREAVTLVATAVGVLLAGMAPWLIWDRDVLPALSYAGIPVAGGLTLVLDTAGAAARLTQPVQLNAAVTWIVEHQFPLNVLVLCGVALLLARARPPAVTSAVLLVLALYTFGSGFFFQYLVWGLPFMIMAGYLREALAIQAAALGPSFILYARPWGWEGVGLIYVIEMAALWAALLVWLVVLSRRALADG